MALSLPPLQQKRMGSGMVRLLPADGVPQPQPIIASERRKAERLLIPLIEEVLDAPKHAQVAAKAVAAGQVEARVTRSAGHRWIEEGTIGAPPGKVGIHVPVHSAEGSIGS